MDPTVGKTENTDLTPDKELKNLT